MSSFDLNDPLDRTDDLRNTKSDDSQEDRPRVPHPGKDNSFIGRGDAKKFEGKEVVGYRSKWQAYLDDNIDDIELLVLQSKPFAFIAAKYSVPLNSFMTWRLNSVHSARIEAALLNSSEYDVYLAEAILLKVKDTENIAQAHVAKELSQFYRWRAKVRAPKVFGDKLQQEVDINVKQQMNDDQFAKLMEGIKSKKLEQSTQVPIDRQTESDYIEYEETK